MAPPDKVNTKSKADQTPPMPEQVTYRPGPDDPPSVTWARHVFHANVPKTVTNADLIAKARNNKFFHVGTFDPAIDSVITKDAPIAPKTCEQYRAHAVAWFKTARSVEELDTKWESEESLRIGCGVGTDDIDYLRTLFLPKRAELKKQDMAA